MSISWKSAHGPRRSRVEKKETAVKHKTFPNYRSGRPKKFIFEAQDNQFLRAKILSQENASLEWFMVSTRKLRPCLPGKPR